MAAFDVEAAFVGQFWAATQEARDGDSSLVIAAIEAVPPEAVTDAALRALFETIRVRWSQGEPTTTEDVFLDLRHCGVDTDALAIVLDHAFTCTQLPWYGEKVVDAFRADRQVELLRVALREAEAEAGRGGGRRARRIAEHLSARLLEAFSDHDASGQPQTFREIAAAELAIMDRTEDDGIPVPYPKLEAVCGPWVPGDVIGLSAFSGGGKSTVAANLAREWARRAFPVIAFPTEMRKRWVSRVWAIEAAIPQWVAEKERWAKAPREYHAAYRAAIAESADWPFAVVNRPNVSPMEIVSAVRVLRKRWSGQTVLVIVDHMHRLNYGSEDPNDAVGPATKAFKNFASDDRDGGLVFLCLYQPRKPSGTDGTHRPVAAAEIRGNSMVWNELDVHLSPFRAWVRASEYAQTAWKTPACLYDPAGHPQLAKARAQGAKLDDEHIYLSIDKRRVGGELGGFLWLNFDAPTGRLYEMDTYRGEAVA